MHQRTRLPFLAAVIILTLSVMGCGKGPETAAVAPVAAADIGQVSDTDVTHHVHTAFLQSELLKGFDITVVTLKGDVRLSGVRDNQAQIDEAIKLARASDGAHTIHDEFTIKK